MKRLLLVLALLCVQQGTQELQAQSRADSAAVLLHAAEQLRSRGEAAAARALLDHIERQYAGTAAAGEVSRMRLAMRRMPEAERSGRTELILWGTTYGAWLGVAVPLLADSEAPEAFGVGLLAGAPLGFLAARAWANARQPSEGQSRAITFGGSWGTYQGFAWAEALDIGDRRIDLFCAPEYPESCYYEEADMQTRVGIAVAGGLAGVATGALLARKPITAGTAAAVGSGALWSTWYGFTLGILADQEDDALLTTTLLAGNAGLIGTALLAAGSQVTEGRVRLINVGGIIGALAGAGMLLIAQPDDEKVAISFPMITSAIGLGIGIATTRDRDLPANSDGGQGALLNLDGRRWALDMPDASIRLDRSQGIVKPAAYVPLLRARF